MEHNLKILPQYYCRVADGSKTFEVRKNDRGFQPGDTVILREYDPTLIEKSGPNPDYMTLTSMSPRTHHAEKGYTDSPPIKKRIGYVLPYGSEMVIFSLLDLK